MLRELAKETDDERFAMVLDQAGSHGAKTLVVPGNIALVPLPPYAPAITSIRRADVALAPAPASGVVSSVRSNRSLMARHQATDRDRPKCGGAQRLR